MQQAHGEGLSKSRTSATLLHALVQLCAIHTRHCLAHTSCVHSFVLFFDCNHCPDRQDIECGDKVILPQVRSVVQEWSWHGYTHTQSCRSLVPFTSVCISRDTTPAPRLPTMLFCHQGAPQGDWCTKEVRQENDSGTHRKSECVLRSSLPHALAPSRHTLAEAARLWRHGIQRARGESIHAFLDDAEPTATRRRARHV